MSNPDGALPVAAIHSGDGFYTKFIDTVTDEDRLVQYKLFASRFEVTVPVVLRP